MTSYKQMLTNHLPEQDYPCSRRPKHSGEQTKQQQAASTVSNTNIETEPMIKSYGQPAKKTVGRVSHHFPTSETRAQHKDQTSYRTQPKTIIANQGDQAHVT